MNVFGCQQRTESINYTGQWIQVKLHVNIQVSKHLAQAGQPSKSVSRVSTLWCTKETREWQPVEYQRQLSFRLTMAIDRWTCLGSFSGHDGFRWQATHPLSLSHCLYGLSANHRLRDREKVPVPVCCWLDGLKCLIARIVIWIIWRWIRLSRGIGPVHALDNVHCFHTE